MVHSFWMKGPVPIAFSWRRVSLSTSSFMYNHDQADTSFGKSAFGPLSVTLSVYLSGVSVFVMSENTSFCEPAR